MPSVRNGSRLFAIDEITRTLPTRLFGASVRDFLKATNVSGSDTKHFDEDFKVRLLHGIDELDENIDGLLIHSENFQALDLMRAHYANQWAASTLIPPYNTDDSAFYTRTIISPLHGHH